MILCNNRYDTSYMPVIGMIHIIHAIVTRGWLGGWEAGKEFAVELMRCGLERCWNAAGTPQCLALTYGYKPSSVQALEAIDWLTGPEGPNGQGTSERDDDIE